ncbi:hypothetical protein [Hymenobacter algoricola]|uniref:hypothetical protein n=1 Tax=Hymenobacter algoricola TaxID=486267 RepID=UPI0031EEA0C2
MTLTLVLLLLKLGHIGPVGSWPWLSVVAPIWGAWCLTLFGTMVYGLIRLVMLVVPRN